ncbi:helix-turn-helix domain-containing protein [Roseomonas chloroacetimidivorans]|uniref:helix-turn-helix domain-containing protein n=1 Tax=Roseomonas chloroacetimidivorans TaxID=1766656 RepID=UPI003C76B164
MLLTGAQIRAARAFVGWSARELSEKAGLSLSTVQRAEGADGVPSVTRANLAAIRAALEAAGVEFIERNGGGPGVRLRDSTA